MLTCIKELIWGPHGFASISFSVWVYFEVSLSPLTDMMSFGHTILLGPTAPVKRQFILFQDCL